MNISQFMRLLDYDTSSEFKIIVTINEKEQKNGIIEINKETHITIITTVNRARIISKNIDKLYISNQTNQYEIKLNNIQCENLARKVVDVFNILLKSIGQEIKIPGELLFIFIIIKQHLGEYFDGTYNII